MKPLSSRLIACAFAIFPACAHALPPQYTVTILDDNYYSSTFFGGYLTGLNNSGQFAGYVPGYTSTYPYYPTTFPIRITGTTTSVLNNLGIFGSQTAGINDFGQITGNSTSADGLNVYAVRWVGTSPLRLFGLGGTSDTGIGINASGQVAGISNLTGDEAYHAVRWNTRFPTDLGTLGGQSSSGFAINASGQVAGDSQINPDSSDFHAVRWTGTAHQDLGTLGGPNSSGTGINNAGQIAGWADSLTRGTRRAVRWDGTVAVELGDLGGSESYATAINNSGDIIGMSATPTSWNDLSAFLYTGGAMYDLTTLLVPGSGVLRLDVSQTGFAINDLGQILAIGDFPISYPGGPHLLRLDPVPAPEPASAVLLLGGAALLGLRRRR